MFLSTVIPGVVFTSPDYNNGYGITMPYNYTRGRTITIAIGGQAVTQITGAFATVPKTGLSKNIRTITIPDNVTSYQHRMRFEWISSANSIVYYASEVLITHDLVNGVVNIKPQNPGGPYDTILTPACLFVMVTKNPVF